MSYWEFQKGLWKEGCLTLESGYQVSSLFFVLSPAELVVVFNMVSVKVRNSVLNSVVDPGEGPGPPSAHHYFKTKMRPEGLKKIFWTSTPPTSSQGLDDRPSSLICRSGSTTVIIEIDVVFESLTETCSHTRKIYAFFLNLPSA